MSNDQSAVPSQMENPLYVGAIATAVVGLLPYVNVFILPPYLIGAFAAVWYAVRERGRPLLYKEGAKLGFICPFLGLMVAAVLGDLIWLFFDYQLWQRQNSQLMLALFASFMRPVTLDAVRDQFAQQAVKPFQWYIFLLQLVLGAIFAGIFGTLFALLAVKIFRTKAVR
jgi:hypothetical protein